MVKPPRMMPELVVRDVVGARADLSRIFGFRQRPGAPAEMELGTQVIRLVEDAEWVFAGHGVIDHLALAATPVDPAVSLAVTRGATLDPEATPDGPVEIPGLWPDGLRYAMLAGPGQARIETARGGGPSIGPARCAGTTTWALASRIWRRAARSWQVSARRRSPNSRCTGRMARPMWRSSASATAWSRFTARPTCVKVAGRVRRILPGRA